MFSFPTFFCSAEPTEFAEDLELEWSVSAAGDLDSASTTQPDDYEDDDDDDEVDNGGDDDEEEIIFEDDEGLNVEKQAESGKQWVHFGSLEEEQHGQKVTKYDPDDVYCYILAGTVPIRPDPLKNHDAVEEDIVCEVLYSERLRKVSTPPLESETEMQYDTDGFPMVTQDESELYMFMELPSLLPPKLLPQQEPIGEQSSRSKLDSSSTHPEVMTAPTLHRSKSALTVCSSPSKPAEFTKRHIHWWGHGRGLTCAAILMAWMGSALSVLTRQSTRFVTLGDPLAIASAAYEPVSHLGLFRIELCFNKTLPSTYEDHDGGCQVLTLGSTDVSDNLYDVARLFGSLGMVLGTFLTLFLTTSVVWESINLRPIGFGLLLTYCFQSFTMLLFDSQVCETNRCKVGAGCLLSIASACFWLGSCVAAAAMEAHKIRATRRRQRRARRMFKRAAREARKKSRQKLDRHNRKESIHTFKTSSTSSLGAGSGLGPDELRSVVEIPSIKTSDFDKENFEKCRYEV
jgi:hypothetical protein